ncbi:hypothetical protein Y1Q_0020502 [Alligator mississippiensis]|uniref:Uncharacterized protein n=1 Tax=Alligator mississippiensis TaxID=8496 RepID=A0A151M629_ALLMI|nr:hypothetical protein Y1Q_0020502 [Alligator mississippiensis]
MHSDAGHAGISAVGSSDPRHGTPWQIWALEPGLLPADGCTPTASSRAPCDSCDVEASWDPSAEEISVGSFPAADFALKTGPMTLSRADQQPPKEGPGRLVKQGESMELQEVFEDVAIADSCAVEAPWDSSAEEISVVSFPAADTALETGDIICAIHLTGTLVSLAR